MRPSKHDVTKLPVWAQNRIEKLEADVEYWKRLYNDNTGESARILVQDDRVVFDPRNRQLGIGRLTATLREDGSLEVYAYDRLIVRPHSSNVIRVSSEEY